MAKVKRLSKYFLVFALMFVTMLGGFGLSLGATHTASATFEDTKTSNIRFENKAMFMEYAGDTLVGLDHNGNFYKMQDGTMQQTGYQFKIQLKSFVVDSYFREGINTLIAYQSGTLVVAGSDGTNTIIYYSTDKGENWISNTIGTKTSVGYPISIQVANGYFGLMTAVVDLSETCTGANILRSTDGKTWTTTTSGVSLDYAFSSSNGQFFRTEYPKNATPVVHYSLDLQNWSSFTSPVETISSTTNGATSVTIPKVSVVYSNNAYYLFGFDYIYTSTNLSTWKLVTVDLSGFSSDLEDIIKAKPYQNGVILCDRTGVWYADISASGLTNLSCLTFGNSMSIYKPWTTYANTIVESEKELLIGFNGYYGVTQSQSDYALAYFDIYQKTIKHEVKFIDYNGTVLSAVTVVDGQTAEVPANPTRTGYTFTGWDGDTTQAITGDTTFIAQYAINTYTVNFVDYNGQTLKTVSVNYGSFLNETEIPSPTREGYTFVGWDKDTTNTITGDTTFIAQYTSDVKLTIRYPGVTGTAGVDGQFHKTELMEKNIHYVLNSETQSEEYLAFYNETLKPWIEDFETDGDYDYTSRFLKWSAELPATMTEDMVIEANFENLYTITLKYYSQVRFPFGDTEYYYPCIVYVQKEILMPYGSTFQVEDFKLNYFEYEDYEGKRPFYDNLYNFDFLGWDKEFEKVTENITYTGKYKLPQVHFYYYDSDFYLVEERDVDITLIPIEDIQKVDGWSRFINAMENFFSLRFGELVEDAIEQFSFDEYVENIAGYSKTSSRVLMPFVLPDVKILAYNGLFTNSNCTINSKNLAYVDGNYTNNDMRYFVDTVAFSNGLEVLTASIEYDTLLDAAYKTGDSLFDKIAGSVGNVFQEVGDFFIEHWKTALIIVVIAIVVLIVIKWFKTGLTTKSRSSNHNNYYSNSGSKKKYRNKKRK